MERHPLLIKKWVFECDKKEGGLLMVFIINMFKNPNPEKYEVVKGLDWHRTNFITKSVCIVFQKKQCGHKVYITTIFI